MSLKEYKAKRNFRQTREPSGKTATRTPRKPLFVVQKHDATRLHYDFRLAMEGVLKSWAVPKGFPTRRGDRRLAVQVEDHPMDYARFEGTIPEGSYGAGTVMVWDLGTYEVHGGDPMEMLKRGKLHLTLQGKKLKGDWTLVRMRPRESDDKPQWLLLKSESDLPPWSARAENQSVLTRRSLERIATDDDAQWQSDRPAARSKTPLERRPQARPVSRRAVRAGPEAGAPVAKIDRARLPKRPAEFVEPMKALLVDQLPRGPEWIYELKFDGVRALAVQKRRELKIFSRNEKDFTLKYSEVTNALRDLPSQEAVLDGEIVALDAEGKSSFERLQMANLPGGSRPQIFYYVFDLLQLDGKDLTVIPLLKRKATAHSLIARLPDTIRFSAGIQADSDRLLKAMQARGLEGLVAKRKDSLYEIGRRSGAWVKFKWTNEQEFIIGGFTPPKGTRPYFGAVLVGYYDRGKLNFASKVGTGFDQRMLKSLNDQFKKLVRRDCPFANLPEKRSAGGRGGLTVAEMRRCTWVEPRLVCQVRFSEWTRDGHLRQPAFLGLRDDRKPKEVVRERPR
jgi:bifunctional non-homologous end joining protein LigD